MTTTDQTLAKREALARESGRVYRLARKLEGHCVRAGPEGC